MFPMPRCESCGARARCEAAGTLRPEYPRCRQPLRDVDIDRTAALLDWLAGEAGVETRTSTAIQRRVLARYAIDHGERPDVLEPSFSCDARGAHFYRFSYGFPTLRRERPAIERAFANLCEPLGAHVAAAARTVLRAARSPAVEQVLFGYAHAEGDAPPRAKLYMQFLRRDPALALDLAGRMLGRNLAGLAAPGPLHLVGLDLGSNGLAGAKLYFLVDRIAVDEVAVRVGPVPLVEALRRTGVTALRDLLVIHRLRSQNDEDAARAAEVDFGLEDNDLRWRDLRDLAPVQALLDRAPRLEALERSFRLAIRRVSGSVGDGAKLNVYYGLAEREAGAAGD